MNILIIEDAEILRESLTSGLRDAGYSVDSAADGREGLWRAKEFNYNLILLDIMLPEIDGFTLLEQLRASGKDTLVLMLTARDQVCDRVKGLRGGADDYLVKPFDFDELLARIEVLLRRRHGSASNRVQVGQLIIDLDHKSVLLNNQSISLPRREYALLECLVLNRDRVVSRTEIEQQIYDERVEPRSNVVDSATSNLRQRIDKPGLPSFIITRRGLGYQLRQPG